MGNQRLAILYGSQTGTAQDVAERIWREAKRYSLSGPVQPMDDYDISQLIHEKFVVFVCSTTGQGEEPDNMKQFWKFLLRRNLPSKSLSRLQFAVLGLGDSSYTKFNFAAKKLYRRLLALGGTSVLTLGLADDQHDLGADAVIDPWISQLWDHLLTEIPLLSDVRVSDSFLYITPRWTVTIHKTREFINPKVSYQCKHFLVTVLSNTRTTDRCHFQDVRLITFGKSSTKVVYQPGDVLMLQPQNLPSNVDALMELLSENTTNNGERLTPDTVFSVTQLDPDMAVPDALQNPLTLRQLATYYWDLNAVPRRYMLQLLAEVTPNNLEQEKLKELASPSGQEEMYNYLNRPKRNILELLTDFPHAVSNIPFILLFELLPPIRPRAFSIASSPQMHEDELQILVAVVKYKTKLVKPRFGLCSNWLASLNTGDCIPVWLRRGTLRFPENKVNQSQQDEKTRAAKRAAIGRAYASALRYTIRKFKNHVPIIMVGPGTGVAPFRSYINDRVSEGTANADVLHLFFGCRYKDKDFHCSEEWSSLAKAKKITLYSAFSRDQEQKEYVQHLILKHASLVGKLIIAGAYIFVAGNSKNMPASVRMAIRDAIATSGMDGKSVDDLLVQMEREGRYQTETWA